MICDTNHNLVIVILLHARVQQTASKRVPIAILLVSDLVPNSHSESMLSRAILDLNGLIFGSSQSRV